MVVIDLEAAKELCLLLPNFNDYKQFFHVQNTATPYVLKRNVFLPLYEKHKDAVPFAALKELEPHIAAQIFTGLATFQFALQWQELNELQEFMPYAIMFDGVLQTKQYFVPYIIHNQEDDTFQSATIRRAVTTFSNGVSQEGGLAERLFFTRVEIGKEKYVLKESEGGEGLVAVPVMQTGKILELIFTPTYMHLPFSPATTLPDANIPLNIYLGGGDAMVHMISKLSNRIISAQEVLDMSGALRKLLSAQPV